jgi:hypothetical protein
MGVIVKGKREKEKSKIAEFLPQSHRASKRNFCHAFQIKAGNLK